MAYLIIRGGGKGLFTKEKRTCFQCFFLIYLCRSFDHLAGGRGGRAKGLSGLSTNFFYFRLALGIGRNEFTT